MSQGKVKNTQEVTDFIKVREERLEQKRKKTEQILFRNLFGVYTLISQRLIPIELLDVQEEGCIFQVLHRSNSAWPKNWNEIPLRFYFSENTYLEILAKIQNAKPSIVEGKRYIQFSCLVDQRTQAYNVYRQFIRFLKLYAQNAYQDTGETTLFYL